MTSKFVFLKLKAAHIQNQINIKFKIKQNYVYIKYIKTQLLNKLIARCNLQHGIIYESLSFLDYTKIIFVHFTKSPKW